MRRSPLAVLFLLITTLARAQARFDLAGPSIDIRVTRAGVSLPIAAIPNLQPGDQIWLHPALPATQSVHYLLIAAFLRGTTNPPPDNWFTRIETWNKKIREEGITVTVPAEAQQAILFLAPETGGDFSTLRSAVRGRPGIFVRASQDLTEAGFEQARIDKYLASLKLVPPGDSAALLDHSNLLARTLALRPNPDCVKRPLDQQYTCLTQTGTQTLLDDGHAQTMIAALSTGTGSDFINAASNTSLAGGGTYSAYVGALVDLVRILNGVHTAQYQYIPAIASPDQQSLNLRLNTAPSFHNPKSVIVIGMPAIQQAVLPPLRPADPNHTSCLLDPHMVLPIEGAPLVFSTAFAHDLVLHLNTPGTSTSTAQDIPLLPDAFSGGLILAPAASQRHELPLLPAAHIATAAAVNAPPSTLAQTQTPEVTTGTVQGGWGFERFTGPTLPLQKILGQNWHVASSDPLIAGPDRHLLLASSATACIQTITLEGATSASSNLPWKRSQNVANTIEITLNLPPKSPQNPRLVVHQYGETTPPAALSLTTFSPPPAIDALSIHANDRTATLTGTSLDQVKSLSVNNLIYIPETSAEINHLLTLNLASDTKPPSFKPKDHLTAEVQLTDGRKIPVNITILPPRPIITILSRRTLDSASTSSIHLNQTIDLPLGAQLIFFLKSKDSFPRNQQIEITSTPSDQAPEPPSDPLHTTLSVAQGSLVLQDSHTVLATFDPLKTLGPSTFGPLRLRALAPDGTPGDWLPLTTIVRLPTLTDLHCPIESTLSCTLSGAGLYLIESVSADAAFTAPTPVPEGFVESTLAIPHPVSQSVYIKLRDDPATVQQLQLPISPGH